MKSFLYKPRILFCAGSCFFPSSLHHSFHPCATGPVCDLSSSARSAHSDFSLSSVATGTASAVLSSSVYVDASTPDVMRLMDSIASMPASVPVVAKGTGALLASVLFLAHMQGRPVHVSQVCVCLFCACLSWSAHASFERLLF